MPIFQGLIRFTQLGSAWSEAFYQSGPGIGMVSVAADLTTLAAKRIEMCGAQTRINDLRVSEVGVFRDALSSVVNLRGNQSVDSDAPHQTVLCTLTSPDFRGKKKVYLRGIWDSLVIEGGLVLQTGPTDGMAGFPDRMANGAAHQTLGMAWHHGQRVLSSGRHSEARQRDNTCHDYARFGLAWLCRSGHASASVGKNI